MVIFFFNETATTEIYTLSLHDALPIFFPETDSGDAVWVVDAVCAFPTAGDSAESAATRIRLARMEKITRRELLIVRSEEHTSELQSRLHLVCRLLLGQKNTNLISHVLQ